MSSEVRANKISPATGTALQISDSGDTTTIPSGATLDVSSATMTGFTIPSGQTLTVASGATIDASAGTATGFGGDNTPAFQAYLTANMALPYDTTTKIPLDGEDFDADGIYDNSTNYRFTVPTGEGGKYMIYYLTRIESDANGSHIYSWVELRKNGSAVTYDTFNFSDNYGRQPRYSATLVFDLAADDYLELWAYINDGNSNPGEVAGGGGAAMRKTVFGAYKMIGL